MNGKYSWNDGWSFLKTSVGTSYAEAAARKKEFTAVNIPHDWLIYDVLNLYQDSVGWYWKRFFWQEKEEKKAFIIFEGIYMDSTVYINGTTAGEWKYGYSAFTLDITEHLRQGENEILISASFHNPNSRWYSGAGIYRNVWFKVTDRTWLPENAVYISTKRMEENTFLLSLEGEIAGERRKEAVLLYRLYDEDGNEVALKAAEAVEACGKNAGKEESCGKDKENPVESSDRKYLVGNVKLWDTENPALYTLHTELVLDGKVIQHMEERFGFRFFRFDPDKGFFLNGRHLKLHGVCEHHDLGALGAAFHKPAMRRKFRILKEMGVNAVRGAHNMMAPGFLELADEMGILVISEAFDMWERSKTTYDYGRFFREWSARDVESWVRQDRNHPCVLMWSIGNEIYDTHAGERGQEITRYLKELVESHDTLQNAPVTLASNYMPWENAQKCADIVKLAGYNYSEKYYEKHHAEHPDWVIYGSETSSIVQSRGIYHFPLRAGILAEDDEQCSALGNSPTSWGAKSLEQCVTLDRDTAFSLGQFLWSGFDYIGEPTPYHTKNSYFGQVDTAGFPKDSYYVWKSAWTDYRKAPMIHLFPYWDFNEGQLIDVRICSNAPFVELFLNGISLGRQALAHEPGSGGHILADYQVPYEKGVLAAAAYDENGRKIAETERRSFGNSVRIVITPDISYKSDMSCKPDASDKSEETQKKSEVPPITADGRDLLFLTVSTVDEEGNPVENACDRIDLRVTGVGRLVGLDNGDSTDFDSYKGTSRRLFSGKLLAIVQADKRPGEIRVEASGRGIQTACFTCMTVADKNVILQKNDIPCGKEEETSEYREENKPALVRLGKEGEIPVRRIVLRSPDGRIFTKDKNVLTAQAFIEPPQADDRELFFKAVNDTGVPVSFVTLEQHGAQVKMTAKGDGTFRLFAMSKSGSDGIRVMSQLEFRIEGLGQAHKNPYEFISASLYDAVKGEVGNGNERGVATGRDGETILSYSDIDFGQFGSDEITMPIFALNDDPYAMQIWEGVPEEEGSEMLADVIYQKPSIWNVYQSETWRLKRRLKGITTISFHLYAKVHIKGFTFTQYAKAWQRLAAGEADAVYGDSFRRVGNAIEQIGNNVSLVFREMDFGENAVKGIAIKGRTGNGANTIHVRFANVTEEIKQIVEFPECTDYAEVEFALESVCGKWDVTFVFLPGSCFDFNSFRFYS